MTNARQIRQIFRPLLERHDDLFQIGTRWLCIRPVHHVLLRVLIEASPHANYAFPQLVMLPTFLHGTRLEKTISYHFIHLFRESIEERYWEWTDSTMVEDLINNIEDKVLPVLRLVQSLEDYGPLYHKKLDGSFFEAAEDRLVIYIALGELEAAKRICLELLPEYVEDKYQTWWLYQNHRTKVMTVAEPLLAEDRQELARILHHWEAANIRGTKFEPYWKPTAFPLEYP